jgi:hypothetical protein
MPARKRKVADVFKPASKAEVKRRKKVWDNMIKSKVKSGKIWDEIFEKMDDLHNRVRNLESKINQR